MRLTAEPDMSVVGEAANGVDALELVGCVQPEVVLMDVAMPVLDGIQTTRLLHRMHPQAAVIVLTIHEDNMTRRNAADAGAAGFVAKSSPVECLLETIRDVARRSQPVVRSP